MKEGTFQVTNVGVFGSLFGTPIPSKPHTAALGLYSIKKRAVVMDDDSIAARNIMFTAMTYDHRLVDGKDSGSFMMEVKKMIESLGYSIQKDSKKEKISLQEKLFYFSLFFTLPLFSHMFLIFLPIFLCVMFSKYTFFFEETNSFRFGVNRFFLNFYVNIILDVFT